MSDWIFLKLECLCFLKIQFNFGQRVPGSAALIFSNGWCPEGEVKPFSLQKEDRGDTCLPGPKS